MTGAAEPSSPGLLQPVLAGVVASLVGFASTFALVLAGLRAVGGTGDQAASGLLALCVAMGLVAIGLGLRHRIPVSIAWSTPGSALLIATGHVSGGYAAALGAFVLCGVLIVVSGLWGRLGEWLGAIPPALANALLAGVLLPVCLAPVRAVVHYPGLAIPGVVAWVAMTRVSRRWAVPVAFAVTAVAVGIDPLPVRHATDHLLPVLSFTAPSFTLGAAVGLGVPLFVVTMASQNVPGIGVLVAHGYRPPLRSTLVSTGGATIAGAPFGAHAINLAAITAAMMTGPDAHPDPARRWVASVSSGAFYVLLGLASGLATLLLAAAPLLVVEAVAGLALLGTLGAALNAALGAEEHREAAVVTFVVTASSITAWGIGAPLWGLLAGLALAAWPERRRS